MDSKHKAFNDAAEVFRALHLRPGNWQHDVLTGNRIAEASTPNSKILTATITTLNPIDGEYHLDIALHDRRTGNRETSLMGITYGSPNVTMPEGNTDAQSFAPMQMVNRD